MTIGIDGRAAYWYRGTGIGTYTYQLLYNLINRENCDKFSVLVAECGVCSFISGKEFLSTGIDYDIKDKFWEELYNNEVEINKQLSLYHIPHNGIGMPKNKPCPFVITLHDMIPFTMPETVGPYYLRKFQESIPEIVKKADAIVTVSEYSKKDICKILNVKENKVFVTPLAAEDIYRPLNKAFVKTYLKNKYTIEKNYIMYAGGFNHRKNISSLIEAYARIKDEIGDIYELVIVGKPSRSFEELVSLRDKLKLGRSCRFTGYIPVNEMPVFYNGASLFVYPSLYEGFGLPILEAMSCGVPVIASNFSSIPEVAGDAALYLDTRNIEALSEAMLKCLLNEKLHSYMCAKSLEHSAKFSWKKTTKETLEVYEKAIAVQLL